MLFLGPEGTLSHMNDRHNISCVTHVNMDKMKCFPLVFNVCFVCLKEILFFFLNKNFDAVSRNLLPGWLLGKV